ncbi:division/outer membrane stress-associated lipid-binding lipoprotein [Colwellia sp. MEBiC06753]
MNLAKFAVLSATVAILQGCVSAAVVGVATVASVATDNRSVGRQIDDQAIEFDAYAALADHKGISENTNLSITSMNGSMLVVGQAQNTYLRDEALKILKKIDNVAQIHNQIRIGNSVSVATKSNDIWLTSKVKTALFQHGDLDASNIKVVTENGEVFLMGLVPRAIADQAVEVARNISGVNRVIKVFEYQ